MNKIPEDSERENRIQNEAIVDAYGEEERCMGWYYYIQDKLCCPFKARCIRKENTSPLEKGEEVEIQGLAPEEECEREILVQIHWQGKLLVVPLSQLDAIEVDEETEEVVEDWHYWVERGYRF